MIEEEVSIERVWYTASREPSDNPLDRNYLAFAPKGIASTTPSSQGFRFLYRHRRRRLGRPWIGPINAALKCLKLATVTPRATSTFSASSASLFLLQNILSMIWLSLVEINVEKTAAWEETALVSEYL